MHFSNLSGLLTCTLSSQRVISLISIIYCASKNAGMRLLPECLSGKLMSADILEVNIKIKMHPIYYFTFYACFRTIVLITLFSQYLTKIKIPVPGYSKERGGFYVSHFPMFKLFPVSTSTQMFRNFTGLHFVQSLFFNLTLITWSYTQVILAIAVSWIICAIITAAGGFPSDPSVPQYAARTDARAAVLKEAKWFRLPYPGYLQY